MFVAGTRSPSEPIVDTVDQHVFVSFWPNVENYIVCRLSVVVRKPFQMIVIGKGARIVTVMAL